LLSSKLEKKLAHYMGKAMVHYRMLAPNDRVLVCLSGGKDSHAMVHLLWRFQKISPIPFKMHVLMLDQGQPGWDGSEVVNYLKNADIPFTVKHKDTYTVVLDKTPEGWAYCSMCSRLRRGTIYRFATDNGYNKIALGHHRDDLICTVLMSMFYNGEIKTMPPKLLVNQDSQILIRPLVYCQEEDLRNFAKEKNFPIIPCNLCGSQDNLMRVRVKQLLQQLAHENPKVPSNLLHALSAVRVTHLMDHNLYNFKDIDAKCGEARVYHQDEW
jgi:tRNA 2-thiocytidine biosynthesis protein TtcA